MGIEHCSFDAPLTNRQTGILTIGQCQKYRQISDTWTLSMMSSDGLVVQYWYAQLGDSVLSFLYDLKQVLQKLYFEM